MQQAAKLLTCGLNPALAPFENTVEFVSHRQPHSAAVWLPHGSPRCRLVGYKHQRPTPDLVGILPLTALAEQARCAECGDCSGAWSPAWPRDPTVGLCLMDRAGQASGASGQAQYLLKLEAFWNQRAKPNLFWDKPRNPCRLPGLRQGWSWLGGLAPSAGCGVHGPGLAGDAV